MGGRHENAHFYPFLTHNQPGTTPALLPWGWGLLDDWGLLVVIGEHIRALASFQFYNFFTFNTVFFLDFLYFIDVRFV